MYDSEIETDDNIGRQGAYICSAMVTIQGGLAIVSALSGDITKKGYIDFMSMLKEKGVCNVMWERHKNGEVIFKQIEI